MNYHWISKQGKERIYNNDSALIVDDEYYSLAVLMDAAQKNDQDTAFIRYFMSKIKDEVLTYQTSRCPDTNDLIQSLIHIQKGMRSQFLFNIASYLILLLPKQESDLSAKIIHCGDCRLGIRLPDAPIQMIFQYPDPVSYTYSKRHAKSVSIQHCQLSYFAIT